MKILFPQSFVAKPGYAALSVDLSGLSLLPIVMRRNDHLYLKKEFHVTLLTAPKELRPAYNPDALRIAARSIEFAIEPLDEFYFVSKFYEFERKTRSSVIVRVKVRGAEQFYLLLAALSGKEVKPAPHHITLYTGGEDIEQKGIGIVSFEQLEAFGKRLDPHCAAPVRSRFFAA